MRKGHRWLWLLFGAMVAALGIAVSCDPPKTPPPSEGWDGKQYDLEKPKAPEGCESSALSEPKALKDCQKGGGIFGFWRIDAWGLPAYEYTLAHLTDPKATYGHSYDPERKTHFHQIGNDRVNGVVTNDGIIELMSQDRGVTFHNRTAIDEGQYGGGYSVLGEDKVAWNTAYRFRPQEAQARRVFGAGYAEMITSYRGLQVTHHITAPAGDAPFLIDQVEIKNLTKNTRKLRHYEIWDLNRHQAAFQSIRKGDPGKAGDEIRNELNRSYEQSLTWKDGVLQADFVWKDKVPRPPRDQIEGRDFYPAPIFLATLQGGEAKPHTEMAAFLGKGGISAPDAVTGAKDGSLLPPHNAFGQPAALILQHDLTIPPEGSVTLRFAFGYLPEGKDLSILGAWKKAEAKPLQETLDALKPTLAWFSSPEAPVLSREMPWHSYYLLSSLTYLEYYGLRVIPQGSTYLYLHGFDGAPRDQALFAIPATYLRPEIARDVLALIMGLTRSKDGGISYSFHGYGKLEDAIIHKHPSDLDIFFLLAINEYLSATGDTAFLDKEVRFHPREAGPSPYVKTLTVRDRIKNAVEHLIQFVQRGPNGLIRIWDGDWSDGIVWENATKYSPDLSIEHGESIPNTQMALYVLPQIAHHVEAYDSELAKKIRQFADELKEPARKEFVGSFFARAWLRDAANQPAHIGTSNVDLEAQPWGIIAGLLEPAQEDKLIDEVFKKLDEPSKIGPTLTPGGMVWPAVSQLMTWAYALKRPDLALRSLLAHSYANQADTFPERWYGIWSGPDGLFSGSGKTWSSVATPMTDWPVMNMNQDGMFLLGALRVMGVFTQGGGLLLQPTGALASYTFDLPLLRLAVEKKTLRAEYRPQNAGSLLFTLAPPKGSTLKKASASGQTLVIKDNAASIRLPLEKGKPHSFEMMWDTP